MEPIVTYTTNNLDTQMLRIFLKYVEQLEEKRTAIRLIEGMAETDVTFYTRVAEMLNKHPYSLPLPSFAVMRSGKAIDYWMLIEALWSKHVRKIEEQFPIQSVGIAQRAFVLFLAHEDMSLARLQEYKQEWLLNCRDLREDYFRADNAENFFDFSITMSMKGRAYWMELEEKWITFATRNGIIIQEEAE